MSSSRGLLILLSSVLFLLMSALIASVSVDRVLGSPDRIQALARSSEIYESLQPHEILAAQNIGIPSFIPLDNPDVQRSIDDAYSPAYLADSGDTVIAGTYRWLEGETQQPEFRIDLAAQSDALADNISEVITARAAELPTCNSAESSRTAIANPLGADCLPPGVTPGAAAGFIEGVIRNNFAALPGSQLNGQTFKPDGNQTIGQILAEAPRWYQALQWGMVVFGILAALCVAALVKTSGVKRGLGTTGYAFIGAGIVMGMLALIIQAVAADRIAGLGAGSDQAGLGRAWQRLAEQTLSAVQHETIIISVIVLTIGVALSVGARHVRQSRDSSREES